MGYDSNGVHDYAAAAEVRPSATAGTGFDYTSIDVLRKKLPPLPTGAQVGHDYAVLDRNESQRRAPPPNLAAMGGSNSRPILRRNTSAPDRPWHRMAFSSVLTQSDQVTQHYKAGPWYHATLGREGAEQKLRAAKKDAPDGLFLLRDTTKSPNMLCLSVTYSGRDKVYHNRVEILADGRFRYLGTGDKSAPFVSCRDLINHHHALHPRVADKISKADSNSSSEGSIRLRAYVPN